MRKVATRVLLKAPFRHSSVETDVNSGKLKSGCQPRGSNIRACSADP